MKLGGVDFVITTYIYKKYIDIYVVHVRLSYGWLDEMLCSGLCAERGLADIAREGWGLRISK